MPMADNSDDDHDAAARSAARLAHEAALPHANAAPAAASAGSGKMPTLKQILLAPEQNGRAVRQKAERSSSQVVVFQGTDKQRTVTAISGTSPAEEVLR